MILAEDEHTPKNGEGALHKYLRVTGSTFEMRHGYCDGGELERYEPMPIYPGFLKNSAFTNSGYPLIRKRRERGTHRL